MEFVSIIVIVLGLISISIDPTYSTSVNSNGIHQDFLDTDARTRNKRNATSYDVFDSSVNESDVIVPKTEIPEWKIKLQNRKYYGSAQYMQRKLYTDNPEKAPTICFNNNTKHNKGVRLGEYICPMSNQSDFMTFCCGPATGQRCCTEAVFSEDKGGAFDDGDLVTGLGIAAAFVVSLSFCMFLYCCCCQRRPELHNGIKLMWVRRSFGKEINRLEQPAYHDHMTVVNSITGLRESRGPSRQGSRGPSRQGSVRSMRGRGGSVKDKHQSATPTPSISRRPSNDLAHSHPGPSHHHSGHKQTSPDDKQYLGSELPKASVVITVTTPSDEHGPTAPLLKTVQHIAQPEHV
ncbi:uncharacterized protein LOC128240134 isoform X2 [Mya arenaria]|uniref:uncharacterized protein LOC128240134 isoform X2 n=1 Tax=Mya arenaria TaxID=6604 RepID=UPI0022E5B0F1|nr:uncharacterized protein LOC128240134 isoform X2 [Mya arenaria]